MNNTLATLPQLSKGYPFLNGQWVGTQPAATPVVPFAPIPSDTVSLSGQAVSTLSGESTGGCVTVKSGDSLSQLLLERGYSLEEMFQKDEQGQTLIDRTAAANKLRNPNLIFPGQELNIPSKENQAELEEASSWAEDSGQECQTESEQMGTDLCPCGDEFTYDSDEAEYGDFGYPDETLDGGFDYQSVNWPFPMAYPSEDSLDLSTFFSDDSDLQEESWPTDNF
jgi:hypothetical protein